MNAEVLQRKSQMKRRDYISNGMERLINQLTAYKINKNVVVTIPNPNKETNKPFIKVNGKDYLVNLDKSIDILSESYIML